jgi:hypothetical protein
MLAEIAPMTDNGRQIGSVPHALDPLKDLPNLLFSAPSFQQSRHAKHPRAPSTPDRPHRLRFLDDSYMRPFANAVEESLHPVLKENQLFPATKSRCHLSRLHPQQYVLHLDDQSRSNRFQMIHLSSPLIEYPTQHVLADLPNHPSQHSSLAFEACNLGAPASKEAHTLHCAPSHDDLASCGDIVFDSQQEPMPEQPRNGDNPLLSAPVNVI